MQLSVLCQLDRYMDCHIMLDKKTIFISLVILFVPFFAELITPHCLCSLPLFTLISSMETFWNSALDTCPATLSSHYIQLTLTWLCACYVTANPSGAALFKKSIEVSSASLPLPVRVLDQSVEFALVCLELREWTGLLIRSFGRISYELVFFSWVVSNLYYEL